MVRSLGRGLQKFMTSGRPKGSRTDNTSSSAEAVVACILDSRTTAGLQHKHSHLEVRGSRSWDPCQKGISNRHATSEAQNTIHTCRDTDICRVRLPASLVTNSLWPGDSEFLREDVRQHETSFITVSDYTVRRRYLWRWRYSDPCFLNQQSCAASNAAVRQFVHLKETWGETQYVGVGSVT